MTNDDKARKAAEEYTTERYIRVEQDMIGPSQFFQCFMAGVAWARAHPEWVKCSERMPEKEVDVLIYCEGEIYIGSLYSSSLLKKEMFECCRGEFYISASDVDMWMPLKALMPPAPEGE